MEKDIECIRCKSQMKFLKEYRFDSQDTNRGLFGAIFDIEEHLIFDVYVCPHCRHTEFLYNGSMTRWD